MNSPRLLPGALLSLSLLHACDDPLKRAQDLDEPRVLGARAQVLGDEARAEPRTLETLQVEFVAGAPDPLQPFGWAFEVCWARPTSFGVGECERVPFASFASDATSPAPRAQLGFVVPARPGGEPQATLLIRGAFCPTSSVFLQDFPQGVRCADPTAAPLPTELRVLTNPDVPNHNPMLGRVYLDGQEWPALSPAAAADCASANTLKVLSGSGEHELRISPPDSAREAIAAATARPATRESLLISHFSTLGKLSRRYSALTPDEPNRDLRVAWETPAEVSGPTLARFFVFVRDLRGGADFSEFALCVEPAP
jgi:hypothetical protein